jgi:hypothetical protein
MRASIRGTWKLEDIAHATDCSTLHSAQEPAPDGALGLTVSLVHTNRQQDISEFLLNLWQAGRAIPRGTRQNKLFDQKITLEQRLRREGQQEEKAKEVTCGRALSAATTP